MPRLVFLPVPLRARLAAVVRRVWCPTLRAHTALPRLGAYFAAHAAFLRRGGHAEILVHTEPTPWFTHQPRLVFLSQYVARVGADVAPSPAIICVHSPPSRYEGLLPRTEMRRCCLGPAQRDQPPSRARHFCVLRDHRVDWQQISLHASYDHLSSGALIANLQRIPAAKLQHMQHGVLHAWTHHLAPAASVRTFYQLLRGRAEFRDRR